MSMSTPSSSVVFSPISVGSTRLKNRFVVPPMVTVFCDTDGMATERFIAYHEAKARGGWGLIIVEDYAVDPNGRGFWTPGLWKDEQIESHATLTERVHAAGGKIFAQIYHCGRQTSSALIGSQPVSASPIPCPVMGEVPHELTVPEIQEIVSQFGDTALRAKKAGFDGVEVHGAHGYLIAQFMSRYSNKRTDGYGGSLENRLRFPLQILAEIRAKCGPDFTIDFRISGDEHIPDGRAIEETKTIAVKLEEAGVDVLHVSAGVYGSAWSIIPPLGVAPGWIVDYAAEVKKVVSIPVITVGRINDPVLAETVIASGKADLVAMGRGSLADPELPKKFEEGRLEDVRRCVACQQGCLEVLFRNEPIRCLVNPTLGFEYLDELKKTDNPKKVTVVGGGPAGMEAARAAALSGHRVTLYERAAALGGEFTLAAYPPLKGEMSSFSAWEARQIEKLGVDIRLGTEYTAAICDREKPDVVILATGSVPAKPPIPGIDGENVVPARDALRGIAPVGREVVVAGGGMIGSESATYFASLGKNVTVVDMLPEIAAEEESTRKRFLMKLMEEQRIRLMPGAKILEITAGGVQVEVEGSPVFLKADTIILALGLTPERSLAQELEGKVKILVVGDAAKPRDALEAVREGFLVGASI